MLSISNIILLNMKRFEEAVSQFNYILERGEAKEPLMGKGEALENLDRMDEALDCYQRAVELDPKDESLWYKKGLLHSRLGDFNSAISAYDRVLDVDQSDKTVWQMKALALQQVGRKDEALISFDYAVGLDPTDKFLWSGKGTLLIELGRPEDAVRCFNKALEFDPNYDVALDGKKMADERIKMKSMEEYARKVLDFEYTYNKLPTREEAFKQLGIPFNYLDSLFQMISEKERIDVTKLSASEMKELEKMSLEVIRYMHDTGTEMRLCDGLHSMPSYDFAKAKRILSYIESVKAAKITYTPNSELDGLVRRAMSLPVEQRNLTDMVKSLNIGVYKARLVEDALKGLAGVQAEPGAAMPSSPAPAQPRAVAPRPVEAKPPVQKPIPPEPAAPTPHELMHGGKGHKCRIHNAQAVMQHYCGQWLCNACVKNETKCPICNFPLKVDGSQPADAGAKGPVLKPAHAPKESRKDDNEFMRL